MVGSFEQLLLAIIGFTVMLAMGAALSPDDFARELRRPHGLLIGVLSQYGMMPLIGFVLILALDLPDPVAIGLLILSCMPGGAMSNIFTYFSKGVLALSVMMTATSTVLGLLLIPLLLRIYAGALDLAIPYENILLALLFLMVPVLLGMAIRKLSPAAGAATEVVGSALSVAFIGFIVTYWVPQNWQLLVATAPATYCAAITLGVLGTVFGYCLARASGLDARTARTVALETGVQNLPLAVAIIALSFPQAEQQAIIAICALYSLWTIGASTLVAVAFRRANVRERRS